MSADPLDKQLVEAVLSRPRRAKADLEEAKLAGLRPSRSSKRMKTRMRTTLPSVRTPVATAPTSDSWS